MAGSEGNQLNGGGDPQAIEACGLLRRLNDCKGVGGGMRFRLRYSLLPPANGVRPW